MVNILWAAACTVHQLGKTEQIHYFIHYFVFYVLTNRFYKMILYNLIKYRQERWGSEGQGSNPKSPVGLLPSTDMLVREHLAHVCMNYSPEERDEENTNPSTARCIAASSSSRHRGNTWLRLPSHTVEFSNNTGINNRNSVWFLSTCSSTPVRDWWQTRERKRRDGGMKGGGGKERSTQEGILRAYEETDSTDPPCLIIHVVSDSLASVCVCLCVRVCVFVQLCEDRCQFHTFALRTVWEDEDVLIRFMKHTQQAVCGFRSGLEGSGWNWV